MIAVGKFVQMIRPLQLSVQVPILRRNLSAIGVRVRRTKLISYDVSCLRTVVPIAPELSIVKLQVNAFGTMTANDSDPSSYSRPDLAKIKHASLTLEIDFDRKIFKGNTLLTFNSLDVLNEVVLDVSKDMDIKSINLEDGTQLKYRIDQRDGNLGSRLVISLEQPSGTEILRKECECKNEELSKDHKPGTDTCTSTIPTHLPLSKDIRYPPTVNLKEADTLRKTNIEHETSNKFTNCSSTMWKTNTIDHVDVKISDRNLDMDSNSVVMALARYEAMKIKMTGVPHKTHRKYPTENEIELYDFRFKVRINYATAPTASALQWLDPAQTSGKTFPYVFSQCQPIHARSIMPCQDTPMVKFTYDAEITVPENFTVLMSALRDGQVFGKNLQKQECCTHKFNQPVPIPSYLLAIVAGVLQWKIIGPRTVVWAEGSVVERAAQEFADTEKYLQAAESLVGPYVWTQYDLLVLPASFPYGGMENPCLTFVTPTLLAGDKSQADVIVHEIMHSWSGNLVTNKNFEHFWLNEGLTVFLERKVTASFASKADRKKIRDFESTLGLQELNEAIADQTKINVNYTKLVPNLEGVHPDDAFSRIPYEKGSLFLRYLEDLVGGPAVFDKFVREYLNNFNKMSLDSNDFKDYFINYFKSNESIESIKWDTWFYSVGMPPEMPEYDTTLTSEVHKILEKVDQGDYVFDAKDVAKFKPNQMVYLLQKMIERPALKIAKLRQFGEAYNLKNSPNFEIKFRWYRLNIKSKNYDILTDVFDFLSEVGRMKYVRPLYRDLYEWLEVRKQAIDHFLQNEPSMMHVVSYTLRTDLHLRPKQVEN